MIRWQEEIGFCEAFSAARAEITPLVQNQSHRFALKRDLPDLLVTIVVDPFGLAAAGRTKLLSRM
jgi:hypothetical protein